MSNKETLKGYSVTINFLDYEKRRDVTKNIVYSEGDRNTAFIYATLTMGEEPINLEGHTVTIGIKNNEGEYLTNGCEVVNAQEGRITIPFTSTALSKVGFNKFEVVIYKGENKLVSPTFTYRVTESVSNTENIENSNDYDVLLVLISQVQGALDNVKGTADRVEGLEQEMIVNERDRKASETQRVSNENTRMSNEALRQSQENHRQTIFNEKIAEVDKLTSSIRNDLDNKIQEVDTELTEMSNTFNEKVTVVNSKIKEVEDKMVEVDTEISHKLTQLDIDVENTINSKFDGKMQEVITHVDTSINEKTRIKFEEVDTTLAQKLLESEKKIDNKILEATESIQNADSKIQEMNTTIDKNVKKVDDKIAEVNITKTQLINGINSKIVEIDTAKNDLSTSIGNKMNEFEDRFNSLESSNPVGELIQARTAIDGTVQETLGKRLKYDYDKKADKNSTYTKSEIDLKIEGITSVDDSTTSTESTWSSQKINSELTKKETIEGSQEKANQAIKESKEYTDEKVAGLIGQSPELLDTLEELSGALGNDPNFATTVTNKIGQKADKSSVYSKEEVDRIVSNSTSIDDENTSGTTTWSSNKISSELGKKVTKEEGKGLSTNDFTNAEKEKLKGLRNYVHPNDENNRHVTDVQISNWNSKADGNHVHNQYSLTTHQHSYSELNDLPNIPSKVSELQNDTGFITRSDVHTHSNKAVIDTITQSKIESWDNKSNFSGNYKDLTGLPTIPVVDVDKRYVDTELGKKANSVDVYTKAEVNNLVDNANPAYNKLILVSDWVHDLSENCYTFEVVHDLNTDKLFISAIDNITKEGMLVGYKIINKSSILITSTEQIECYLTIVNGSETIKFTEGSDTKNNLVFEKTLSTNDWSLENGKPTAVIRHRLFTQKLFVSAIDLDTNEGVQLSYKILGDNQVEVSTTIARHILVTLINGEREYIHLTKESEIDDTIVSSGATWSSKKVENEINSAKQPIQELQTASQESNQKIQHMEGVIDFLMSETVGERKTTVFNADGSIEEKRFNAQGILYKTSITSVRPDGGVEVAVREKVGVESYKEYKIITTFNQDGSISEEVVQ